MEMKITKISTLPQLDRKKRVAAYARVSTGKDAMLHSLSAQVSYYNNLIQNNNEWEFAGIYADEAMSGTRIIEKNLIEWLMIVKLVKLI